MAVRGGSIFTGLGDFQLNGPNFPDKTKPALNVFAAHVLDVCLNDSSDMFSSPSDIGKIRYRNLTEQVTRGEEDITDYAWPLDRTVQRYPMPGEEVMIFVGYGDISLHPKFKRQSATKLSQKSIGAIAYYSFVVSTLHNVSFNGEPFLLTNTRLIDPQNKNLSVEEAAKRFDAKRIDLQLSKTADNSIRVYKQLQPFEGDFILQGRFGNSIRFSSTSGNQETPWAPKDSPGVAGDGVMILRVDRDSTTSEKDMFTVEDLDKDDSIICLGSSQRLEMKLACSKELKSWKNRYLTGTSKDVFTSKKDTSVLWQKVVDSEKPLDQEFRADELE